MSRSRLRQDNEEALGIANGQSAQFGRYSCTEIRTFLQIALQEDLGQTPAVLRRRIEPTNPCLTRQVSQLRELGVTDS